MRRGPLAVTLSMGLAFGAACGSGGVEKDAAPTSTTNTSTTEAKKPTIPESPERTKMLKELEQKKHKFEADLKDRRVKVTILAGKCAVIGIKRGKDYVPFLIPNPGVLDVESGDRKLGLTLFFGLDNQQSPIYGPTVFTKTGADGGEVSELLPGSQKGAVISPKSSQVQLESAEVYVHNDSSIFHKDGQEYLALQAGAQGLGSFEDFANDPFTEKLCDIALQPDPKGVNNRI